MTGPGEEKAARWAGRDHLRASHADREQAIEVLKAAFVEGRLTRDELDSRAGQAFASLTYAELAAVTADIPAESAAVPPPRPARARPGQPANPTVKAGGRVIMAATILTAAVWAGASFSQADNAAVGALVWAFTFTWLGIVCLVGAVMLESRHQRRTGGTLPPQRTGGAGGQPYRRSGSATSAGQLPTGPGQRRREPEGRPGRTGDDPAPPGARADQAGTDLRTQQPRRDRRYPSGRGARAPLGTRPAPGAV